MGPICNNSSLTKYKLVTVSTIHLSISVELLPGYFENILETFLPDESNMSKKEEKAWIKQNNKRMEAICQFLNENNL